MKKLNVLILNLAFVVVAVAQAADKPNLPTLQELTGARAHLDSTDAHRPRFHFTPPQNWMNDPNGLIQYKGVYHLFYQHNPWDAVWGDMHWGHATSLDLVHWTDRPIALPPTPGTFDEGGCFSGCAVVNDDGLPTFIYTGVLEHDKEKNYRPQSQGIAVSHDGLETFVKHPDNPLIPLPPSDFETKDFRDPCVWKDGDWWYNVIGSGEIGGGGKALLYRSHDLVEWEYLNPILTGDPEESGRIWECPSFFKLDGKWVLFISPIPGGKVKYFVGDFDGRKFTPDSFQVFDYGSSYAPQTFVDEQGRRLLFGWIREDRRGELHDAAGWAGAMSLPQELTLNANGKLNIAPVGEVKALRRNQKNWAMKTLTPGSGNLLADVSGNALEIWLDIEPGDAEKITLSFYQTPDGAEQTHLVYDVKAKTLGFNRSQSSLQDGVGKHLHETKIDLGDNEHLLLNLFLDRSVVELFANQNTYLATRVYPTKYDAQGMSISVQGGSAKVNLLSVWEMQSITQ